MQDMDPKQGHVDAESQPVVSWEVAGQMASRYLPQDNSSMEASVLSRGGIRLLQAVIYELRLSPDHPDVLLSACYSFLQAEQITPGSVIARLLSSESPEVVSVAKDVQAHGGGEGWVVTETPPKNLFVLTALMNLPSVRRLRSALRLLRFLCSA